MGCPASLAPMTMPMSTLVTMHGRDMRLPPEILVLLAARVVEAHDFS